MPYDNDLALGILAHLLQKETGHNESIESDNTTYNFFDNGSYQFAIIIHDDGYKQLSVISADYSTVVGLNELLEAKTEKGQIAWDLLEQGGIRENSFRMLYKQGIVPNTEELKDIDFSQVKFR